MNRWIAIASAALVALVLVAGSMFFDAAPAATSSPAAPPTGPAASPTTASPSAAVATGPPPPTTAAMRSDFNGDGFADLAVGMANENDGAGVVHVLYGSFTGLTAKGNQLWSRDSPFILGAAETNDGFGSEMASGDFDSDGFADLAIAAPDLGYGTNPGGVNVLFGSPAGLTSDENELWLPGDIPGLPSWSELGAGLGRSIASSDFDGDGFDDLAIGGGVADSDAGPDDDFVAVLRGGGAGLETGGPALKRAMTGATSEPDENYRFGDPLAAGDLNGDGLDDLAVGATGGGTTGGEVAVFFGSERGLAAEGSQIWSQDSPGVEGTGFANDDFGAALAIGDFDGDGFGDLAVGVPGEVIGCSPSCYEVGAVNVLRGSPTGLTADGNQIWSQDTPGLPGNPEVWDHFGEALAAGDFDGDGADDLAIGASGEDQTPGTRPFGAGAVTVMYGSARGLSVSRVRRFDQDSPGVPGEKRPGDMFGRSLSAAQFGGSSNDDLAIGVPKELIGDLHRAGQVNVLYGGSDGLDGQDAQAWSRGTPGILGELEKERFFGTVVGS